MKTYEQVRAQHEEHQYKRGQFKGDAPADPARRGKNHFRIIKNPDGVYAIRFHNTDILTYYPDGTVMIDGNGWESSITTREAFAQYDLYVTSVNLNGYINMAWHTKTVSQKVPFVSGTTYNMFTGKITHPETNGVFTFSKYVADKEARKELREAAKDFRAVLPILNAARTTRIYTRYWWANRHDPEHLDAARRAATTIAYDPEAVFADPEQWPALVAAFWCEDHRETWALIYSQASRKLKKVQSGLVTF